MIDDKVNEPKQARDVFGMFQTVSAAPTQAPKNFLDQVQVYTSGATYRLYWYDKDNDTWHYITATA